MTPLKLAHEIAETFDPRSRPVEVRELCHKILMDVFDDPDEALERATSAEHKVVRHLTSIVEKASDEAVAVRFSINESSSYFIHGSCFPLPNDRPEVIEAKKRRAHAWSYASQIARLNPTEFEGLCCGLLSLIGVESPSMTRRSGDEGVDFFGRIALSAPTLTPIISPNLATKMHGWIIGQAKHYKKTVAGTPELRDLFGAIELAKARVTNPLGTESDQDQVRIADPILYLFVTSGRISSRARSLLSSSGVYGVDGEMLSTFLSDHAVGVDANGQFDSRIFKGWIGGFME